MIHGINSQIHVIVPGKEVDTPQFLTKLQIQPIVTVYVLETGTTLA